MTFSLLCTTQGPASEAPAEGSGGEGYGEAAAGRCQAVLQGEDEALRGGGGGVLRAKGEGKDLQGPEGHRGSMRQEKQNAARVSTQIQNTYTFVRLLEDFCSRMNVERERVGE